MKTDEYYMNIPLEEAKIGRYYVKSNQMVGAVIVKNDKIISSGYHKYFGREHAEVNAINSDKKIFQEQQYI